MTHVVHNTRENSFQRKFFSIIILKTFLLNNLKIYFLAAQFTICFQIQVMLNTPPYRERHKS